MIKEQIIKSLKISLGTLVAILIARALNLQFYSAVGTIVIVSMLSSKKQSLKLAGTRLLTAILSLALSSILFLLFGFSLGVLGLYLLIFIFLMYLLRTKTAIVLNVVLVMHIYSVGEVSLSLLLNEFTLMFLGVTVALVFNFFMLDIEGDLVKDQKQAEEKFLSIFENMGLCLINECRLDEVHAQLEELDHILSAGKEKAYKHMNSYYLHTPTYYVEYFSMRRQQFHVIKKMPMFLNLNFIELSEVQLLKDFTDKCLYRTDVLNDAGEQVEKLMKLKELFNQGELPTTHRQLKNRIALNQYLYALEEIIALRARFVEKFKDENYPNLEALHV